MKEQNKIQKITTSPQVYLMHMYASASVKIHTALQSYIKAGFKSTSKHLIIRQKA